LSVKKRSSLFVYGLSDEGQSFKTLAQGSPSTCFKQGDQIGQFWPNGLLLEAYYDLKKDEVAQRNVNILGFSLIKQIYYIFI
jgi:hypothetical protein